jgi:hypothetical protein
MKHERQQHIETWTEFPRNTPFVVNGQLGVFRYRYHFRLKDKSVRVALFGGKPPAQRVAVDASELVAVSDYEMQMIKHASERKVVLLDQTKEVTLFAWDVNRPKVKIITATGAVLTVLKERLALPEGENPP